MYERATSKYPHLTADTQAFIEALSAQNAAPLETLTYEKARSVLLNAQTQQKISPDLDCVVEDTTLPVGSAGTIDVRFYRPKDSILKVLPVLIYFHGGGWVMGDKRTHERLMREICIRADITVLFVNYQPAPQGQYPTVINDNYAAVKYVIQNATDYQIDPAKVVIGGDSVGGNMAAVLALMLKEKNGPRILKQFLLYPVTDASMSSPSYTDFENGPWLTKKAMAYFWQAYAPDVSARKEIYASPINATEKQLKNLPAAFVITAENDVLRDEGELYAFHLMRAGVDVTAVRYNGTIHDFLMLDALADTTPAQSALSQLIAAIREAVHF